MQCAGSALQCLRLPSRQVTVCVKVAMPSQELAGKLVWHISCPSSQKPQADIISYKHQLRVELYTALETQKQLQSEVKVLQAAQETISQS